MRRWIAAVERYLKHRPGMIGIVLRDRSTGAVWRNRYAGSQIYMATTSKLAMAVTLLLQNQAGVIHLTPTDLAVMYQMLHVSSDNAADDLWFKYGASFYTSNFPRIGLTGAQYLRLPGRHRDGHAGGGDPLPRPPGRGGAGERHPLEGLAAPSSAKTTIRITVR